MTPQEYEKATKELTRHRVMANFEAKYSEAGGIMKLQHMIEAALPYQAMAQHFGVSTSRVAVIVPQIIGMPYSDYLVKKKVRRPGVWRKGGIDKRRGPKPRGTTNDQLSTQNQAP